MMLFIICLVLIPVLAIGSFAYYKYTELYGNLAGKLLKDLKYNTNKYKKNPGWEYFFREDKAVQISRWGVNVSVMDTYGPGSSNSELSFNIAQRKSFDAFLLYYDSHEVRLIKEAKEKELSSKVEEILATSKPPKPVRNTDDVGKKAAKKVKNFGEF